MTQNDQKWSKMTQNDPNWSEMTKIKDYWSGRLGFEMLWMDPVRVNSFFELKEAELVRRCLEMQNCWSVFADFLMKLPIWVEKMFISIIDSFFELKEEELIEYGLKMQHFSTIFTTLAITLPKWVQKMDIFIIGSFFKLEEAESIEYGLKMQHFPSISTQFQWNLPLKLVSGQPIRIVGGSTQPIRRNWRTGAAAENQQPHSEDLVEKNDPSRRRCRPSALPHPVRIGNGQHTQTGNLSELNKLGFYYSEFKNSNIKTNIFKFKNSKIY